MKAGLRVLAVVPARGGSDRVPYLNIKRLGDRPLLAHTLDAARQAETVDRVVVSTDDPRVAEVAREWGAEAPFLRPAELAGDIPSLKPVIVHAVRELEQAGERADVVVVLQATTPFREASAVDQAVTRLLEGGFDSVVSVTEDRTLNWRDEGGRLVPLFAREGRRDEQPPLYKENGAVVALRRAVLDGPTRFGEAIGYLVLDKRAAFTVHDLEDFWMAERLQRQPRILFRVDGSTSMGMGHVYRSLAIADALRGTSQADLAFLMSADHDKGIVTVSRHGYPVRVAGDGRLETYLEHIRDYAPHILINDLPVLEDRWLRALSHLGASTINLVDTLDDLERTEHYAQIIVSVMNQDRETPEGFYGGPAFSHLDEFQRLADELPRRVPLIQEAGGHIAELMLEADLVVCSGGMSVYEIAALGTPGVVLAQNAREDARMQVFARHGSIEYLGLGTEVDEARLREAVVALLGDPARRRAMSTRGRELVDGLGAARAAEVVLASVAKA